MSPPRLLLPNHHTLHPPGSSAHGNQRTLPTGLLVGHKSCPHSSPDNAYSGWRLLMLLQSNVCVNCELSKVSRFHWGRHYLLGRSRRDFANQRSPSRSLDIKLQMSGFKYSTMSSQTIKKEEKDYLGFTENSQQLPLAHSYEAAMDALSSLISRQKRSDRSSVGGKYVKLERMAMYLKILGLEEKIQDLKIIHVAGTKGKGSTCVFCEAILRECGFRTGLFISPHLIDVRERFRLDGLDISREKFLMYFWDCWSILKEKISEDLPMPPLFQFLTLLAFKIFLSEKVDVAIIEVGLGGKNDTTNVIKEPMVCGIASLGMDHTEILGDTIGEIASHKAGIFKPHVPAFTVPQLSEAMDVIQEKAEQLMVPLNVADPLDANRWEGLTLGLSGVHQFVNAGLAVSLCKCWLQRTGNWDHLFEKVDADAIMPAAFLRGLSTARLSGRAQIVHDTPTIDHSAEFSENVSGELIFYLDGAHSPESMEACARWFSDAVTVHRGPSHLSTSSVIDKLNSEFHLERKPKEETQRVSKQILLFNCMDVRDPETLLPQLVNICASSGTHFSNALFVPSMSTYNKVTSGDSIIAPDIHSQSLSWQLDLQKLWEKIVHGKEPADTFPKKSSGVECMNGLPPYDIIYKDISHCNPAGGQFTCSAVIPSLPLTIKWLRDCVRENPSLRLQVLVTGSLHLVGDVLKLLRR
ncbi:hypothetical protein MLD38_031009 [Melastoma candidum]|uniref:Uncharacterized protein n=1 Tax=Melastoma candidum TaxID=119954 RepID=A0ACB9MN89_9MYRT|nr:hypothetical protein MLD38_031009 [Melastoma candidum]